MKKPEIVDHLSGLDTGLFDRGYHHPVGDGEWYEVFINKTIKEKFDLDTVAKFLMEFHYVCLKIMKISTRLHSSFQLVK